MINLQNMMLDSSKTIKDALELINSNEIKLILVVNKDLSLLGTITDGDLRRFLLQGSGIASPILHAMNKEPITGNISQSHEELIHLMSLHEISAIPIIDDDGSILDVETAFKDNIVRNDTYENPVFLMAGGLGTRLQPLTDNNPKPMLKVGGKPLLELILKNFVDHGFSNFYISVQYLPEIIKDYFGDGEKFGVTINYIEETEPLGTGGALGLLPKFNKNLPIIVMNGDILTSVDFPALLDYHHKHKGIATMCVRDYEYQVPFGVVEGEETKILSMHEKPIQKWQVNAGIYVLNNSIAESAEKNTRIDMTDILSNNISVGNAVHMFPIYEYWLDIGRLEDFNKAQIDYSSSE